MAVDAYQIFENSRVERAAAMVPPMVAERDERS